MKILFCTNTFENVVNGPSKFAGYLLEMNKLFDDTEVRILTEDVSCCSVSPDQKTVFRLDLTLSSWTRPWGFIYRMFPYYRACREIHKTYPYDVLVFNNAITGIWSALRLRICVLGMINDDTSLNISLKEFNGSRKWFRHLIFRHLEKIACRMQQGIIVNSRYLEALVIKKYRINPGKVHLLYKGVRINKTPSFKLQSCASPVKVLFVKADYVRGGLFDLINALGLLKDMPFELQIAGPAWIYKQAILSRNHFSNVTIDFIGPVSQTRVENLFKQNELFIVPSHQEALGVANIEAIANGLTVVSTHVGGIPEVLDHGRNGWMVDPGRPDKLAVIIQYIILHPEEALQRKKEGYGFICDHFSHTGVLIRFREILNPYRS